MLLAMRLRRVWVIARKANLGFVRQTVFPLSDTIHAVPGSRCEDQQAWFDTSDVSIMYGTEVGPDLNRVAFTALGVCLEAADALQVHA